MRASRSVTTWERVHIDRIGKWEVEVHVENPQKIIKQDIRALTMICEVSLWPEIARAVSLKSWHIAKLFDTTWLCRYPRPNEVINNNGKELVGMEFQELLESYAIRGVPTTVKKNSRMV